MSPHLLNLPTEILDQILAPLPIPSLLSFSSTSHHARHLANSNLHSLALSIQSPSPYNSINPSSSPYDVWLRIPNAKTYDYATLFNFQTALVRSVLLRHVSMLHTLKLSVWALTPPIAEAIAGLGALRHLHIRIEKSMHGRNVARSCIALERMEQEKAWNVLGSGKAVWTPRLRALHIEDAELGIEHLVGMLSGGRCLRELWLSHCKFIGREVWGFLKRRECVALRVLGLADYGCALDEGCLDVIESLRGLQYLDLYDCYGLDSDIFELCNSEVWHIPRFVAPGPIASGKDMPIEVDPEYM